MIYDDLSTSCHVSHKASTHSSADQLCQPLRFVPHFCQFLHPAFSLSISAVLLHAVLGLPRFRRPSGFQVNAVLQLLFGSFLMMFHLRLRTSSLRFSISATIGTSLFVILSCQRILNIRLIHLLKKTSILLSSFLFFFHVSQPYFSKLINNSPSQNKANHYRDRGLDM